MKKSPGREAGAFVQLIRLRVPLERRIQSEHINFSLIISPAETSGHSSFKDAG